MDGRETRDRAWRQVERDDGDECADDNADDGEICRDCGLQIDDGEGYDGRCGDCADAWENRTDEPATDTDLEAAFEDAINGGLDIDQEPF